MQNNNRNYYIYLLPYDTMLILSGICSKIEPWDIILKRY